MVLCLIPFGTDWTQRSDEQIFTYFDMIKVSYSNSWKIRCCHVNQFFAAHEIVFKTFLKVKKILVNNFQFDIKFEESVKLRSHLSFFPAHAMQCNAMQCNMRSIACASRKILQPNSHFFFKLKCCWSK